MSPVKPAELACLPTIDFAGLNHRLDLKSRSMTVETLGKACKEMGCFQVAAHYTNCGLNFLPCVIFFLQVINHGISQSVMKGAKEVALDFFETSTDEKDALASNDIRKPVRYGASSKDSISDSRCFLKKYAHPLQEWIPLWPLSPPDYREKMGKYALEVRRVALQLMDAILESLGVSTGDLNEQLDEGMQVMAVNFYPQCSTPDLSLGLPAHSDYGCITILLQSCEGLQVIGGDGNAWQEVPQVPEALHVHIGDYMEVLSNGRYKSVLHRAVLNPDKKRVSVASIHGFSMDKKVAAAKEMVDEQHPKGYKESSFRDFLDYIEATDITKGKSFIDSLRLTST
ncbi:flavanone 3-dioxygenase 3-like [Dioscorea cayenensis subsp. rotundata]|uniref:Flavanone 3-dioxygenase 3-like n=1 Tax=Dioscorea cayennensis subsp. rotundata TaxID=55577 RepID=A0AB40B2W3_DIOCR|nr:flavanone 3-dioxygenase 3-like [Dioscorea cayenensis subsp. rotundata]